MHKIFGLKTDASYFTRTGAYLVPIKDVEIGVVKTAKGLFLLGGGLEAGETDAQCIQRECIEETGFEVAVGDFVCSAEAYTRHPSLGFFHPVQKYYTGTLIRRIQSPIEMDHELVWLDYSKLMNNLFVEMQNWALEQCWNAHRHRAK